MLQALLKKLRTYLRRLLLPLYLFPLKLFTFSLYYALRVLGRLGEIYFSRPRGKL